MVEINKKSLQHLAALSRLKLETREEEKFLADLQKILDHFKELKAVDTDEVQPMTGGTVLKNIFRQDDSLREGHDIETKNVVDSFPEQERGFLKVPPVFE